MARILGSEIPNEKRIVASLPYIYGIGRQTATRILEHAGVDENIRTGKLTEEQLVKISSVITSEAVIIEGDLRREVSMNIKRLMDLGCNRGIRHRLNLPLRGQRTKTNARTRKGPRKPIRR